MRSCAKFAGLAALVAIVLGSVFSSTAHAAFVMYVYEDGTDLKISGSGKLNVAALESSGYNNFSTWIYSNTAMIHSGVGPVRTQYYTPGSPANMVVTPTPVAATPLFTTATSAAFTYASASSTSGDYVGIQAYGGSRYLYLPGGYVSGTDLSTVSTYLNQSYTSLKLIPGDYVWSWGSDATADTFTLKIGTTPPAVPEPAALSVVGLAAAGLLARRRRA